MAYEAFKAKLLLETNKSFSEGIHAYLEEGFPPAENESEATYIKEHTDEIIALLVQLHQLQIESDNNICASTLNLIIPDEEGDASSIEIVSKIFVGLANIGASATENEELFEDALGYSEYLENVAALLDFFNEKKVSVDTPDGRGLIHTAVFNADYAPALLEVFNQLSQCNATPANMIQLYITAAENSSNAESIQPVLQTLVQLGINAETHTDIINAALNQDETSESMSELLMLLKKTGATFDNRPDLYMLALENGENATSLLGVLTTLNELGATSETHHELFTCALSITEESNGIPDVFRKLNELGLSIQEHSNLYLSVFNQHYHAEKILEGMQSFSPEAGESEVNSYARQTALLLEQPGHANNMIILIRVFESLELSVGDNQDLFYACGSDLENMRHFKYAFEKLKDLGIRIPENTDIYMTVLECKASAYHLPDSFQHLTDCGATIPEHLKHFLAAIKKSESSEHFHHVMTFFEEKGITLEDDEEIISASLADAELAETIIKQLQSSGFTYELHPHIYKRLLSEINQPNISVQATHKMLVNLKAFARKSPLITETGEAFSQQQMKINKLLDEITNRKIMYGPLVKGRATKKLEHLLTKLVDIPVEQITMSYDEFDGYTLAIEGEAPVNISILLKHANLSHLILSEELVDKIGHLITQIGPFNSPKEQSSILLKLVPTATGKALSHYISQHYKNINRLFRGEELIEDRAEYVWVAPGRGSPNMLINFLSGCLISDAANRLVNLKERALLDDILNEADCEIKVLAADEGLYVRSLKQCFVKKIIAKETERAHLLTLFPRLKELVEGNKLTINVKLAVDEILKKAGCEIGELALDKDRYTQCVSDYARSGVAKLQEEGRHMHTLFPNIKEFFPEHLVLVRGERVSEELARRRNTTVQITPAITSFSADKEGSPYFKDAETVKTTLRGDFSQYPVFNEEEGEIVLSQGEQLEYVSKPDGGFEATLVRSPTYQRPLTDWSSNALAVAYREHLSNAYRDKEFKRDIGGKTIQRPNHGLAHTYRVMQYIEPLINYFAEHSTDGEFKQYCQEISGDEVEWLKVSAAFSITGRESEMSAGEDLELYDTYRASSCAHLEDFLQRSTEPEFQDEAMKERISHVVRYMGNPGYEKSRDGETKALNSHEDPTERAHRNHLHRLLTFAHKLDLVRCYEPEQFQRAMQPCLDLSTPGEGEEELVEEQLTDYNELVRYAIELCKAQGNALEIDITPDNQLEAKRVDYSPPFHEASSSLKRIDELSEQVVKPSVKEPPPNITPQSP